jgi:uncharacterized lipoprotein YddW (UPF0748 family)
VVDVEEAVVRQGLAQRVSLLVGASVLAIVFLASCTIFETAPISVQTSSSLRVCAPDDRRADCPPPAPREFRAVWVATVANIDWPTKPGLPVAQQKAEVTAMLNRLQALNMNAVLLQVRPSADAIYPSTLEPWAEWITGEQGRSPGYDPLQFWIDEARARGIEVHAWFNPYRARHTKAVSPNAKDHVSARFPNAVKSYGGFQWLDPGEHAAQDHSFAVIMDVVKRYDIDGVHFDDYFYPYPVTEQTATQQVAGQNAIANALNSQNNATPSTVTRAPEREVDFPDEPSWNAYVASGGKLTRADWRRDNVNRFVERVYRGVKAEKPWVRFGISPFGIGRPDRRPPGIQGFSQYDKLYADVELWLQRGWLDYLAPQLYWAIAQTPQAFPVLLDYWHAQNTLKRDIFPGLYTSRIDDSPRSWMPKEIEDQIALARAKQGIANEGAQAIAQGHIHFSAAPIVQNRRDIQRSLSRQYVNPALNTIAHSNRASRSNWIISEINVNLHERSDYVGVDVLSSMKDSANVRMLAVYARYGSDWQFSTVPLAANFAQDGVVAKELSFPKANSSGALNAIAVSFVDRDANESPRYVREFARP